MLGVTVGARYMVQVEPNEGALLLRYTAFAMYWDHEESRYRPMDVTHGFTRERAHKNGEAMLLRIIAGKKEKKENTTREFYDKDGIKTK